MGGGGGIEPGTTERLLVQGFMRHNIQNVSDFRVKKDKPLVEGHAAP